MQLKVRAYSYLHIFIAKCTNFDFYKKKSIFINITEPDILRICDIKFTSCHEDIQTSNICLDFHKYETYEQLLMTAL